MASINFNNFDSPLDLNSRAYKQVEGTADRYDWNSGNGGRYQVKAAVSGTSGIAAYRINCGNISADMSHSMVFAISSGGVIPTTGEVLFKVLNDNTWLMARYSQFGAHPNSAYEIWKRVSGTWTQLATASASGLQGLFPASVGSAPVFFNVYAKIVGNVISMWAEYSGGTAGTYFAAQYGGTPDLTYTLTGGDATQFGSGVKGGVGWRHTWGAGDTYGGLRSYSVRSDDAAPAPAVFAVGNGAINNANSLAVASQIVDANHVAYMGDVVGPNAQGDATGFTSGFEPVYSNVKGIVLPAVGDRDWSAADPALHTQAGAYDDYWDEQARPANKHFYAFNYFTESGGDPWRIIVLNTANLDDEQLRFLDFELDREPGDQKIVFGHHPRFSAGTVGGEGDNADIAPIWDLLPGRAIAYISGHPHHYERHAARNGVTQIIAGAGGESLTAFNSGYSGLALGNSANYGILRLRATQFPTSLEGTYISSAGATLDSFTIGATSPGNAYKAPQTALDNPWKFILTSADGNTIHGEMKNASDRSVSDPHMGTASISFSIRTDHPLALKVLNEECLIKAYRGNMLIAHGPIVTVEEAGGGSTARALRVTAAGAWWNASKRIIRQSTVENGFTIAPGSITVGFGDILRYANGFFNGSYFDEHYTGISE
jgi:hypothetical protein